MKVPEIRRRLLRKVPAFSKKLALVYTTLKWEWCGYAPRVPNDKEIAATLRRLIRTADLKNIGCDTTTGGLHVGRDNFGVAYIRFSVDEVLYL